MPRWVRDNGFAHSVGIKFKGSFGCLFCWIAFMEHVQKFNETVKTLALSLLVFVKKSTPLSFAQSLLGVLD